MTNISKYESYLAFFSNPNGETRVATNLDFKTKYLKVTKTQSLQEKPSCRTLSSELSEFRLHPGVVRIGSGSPMSSKKLQQVKKMDE